MATLKSAPFVGEYVSCTAWFHFKRTAHCHGIQWAKIPQEYFGQSPEAARVHQYTNKHMENSSIETGVPSCSRPLLNVSGHLHIQAALLLSTRCWKSKLLANTILSDLLPSRTLSQNKPFCDKLSSVRHMVTAAGNGMTLFPLLHDFKNTFVFLCSLLPWH